jgi:hypothetical protein
MQVFKPLAERQLSEPEEAGMAFQVLYRLVRERFLVSSEVECL